MSWMGTVWQATGAPGEGCPKQSGVWSSVAVSSHLEDKRDQQRVFWLSHVLWVADMFAPRPYFAVGEARGTTCEPALGGQPTGEVSRQLPCTQSFAYSEFYPDTCFAQGLYARMTNHFNCTNHSNDECHRR